MNTQISQENSKSIAVVGCGEHMCRAHLDFVSEFGFSQLNFFDPDSNAEKRIVSSGLNAIRAEALTELFQDSSKMLWIGSPDQYHYKVLQSAIERGIHTFVEKPLATKTSELEGLKTLLLESQQKGIVISSCHPRHFDPPFLMLKQLLPSLIEKFGPACHFSFDFAYHKPSEPWKANRSLLLDHANHEVDLMRWMFGESACCATKLVDAFDRYSVAGVRTDRLSFSFMGLRTLESSKYQEFVSIRFERGQVDLNAGTGEIRLSDFEHETSEVSYCEATNYLQRNRSVTEDFILAVRNKAVPYLTISDLFYNTAFAVILAEDGFFDDREKIIVE